jgi:capsular exopolysaccharide synthesis family protein
MDLRAYLRLLRRGWPVVLALVVLGVAAGVGLTLATTKVYRADVQTIVSASSISSTSDLAQGNSFVEQSVQSYTSIANSPTVTDAVVRERGVKLTASALAAKISADAPLNKVLINLHVTDTDPRHAARLANLVAVKFVTAVQDIAKTDANGSSVVKISVIHPAVIPTEPIKPNKLLNVGLGLVLGLLIGIGVVVLRDVLDTTVKGPSDFDDVGVPVLGQVPLDKRTTQTPIAFRGDPHGVRAEAYRQLRTNLQFVNVDDAPRIIAVTSAIPGEGKTTTAMNLAAALAEAGHRVCLIEADLRRPTIASTLGLVAEVGFTTVLIGKASVDDALQSAGRNLQVLTSGPVPPNPSELLISEHARAVILEAATKADYTIIDTAPLLPVADGAEIAAFAQATIVVHRAGKTTREQVERSVAALAKVGEKPVGVVLNMVSRGTGGRNDQYDYYYTYGPAKDASDATAEHDQRLTSLITERQPAINGSSHRAEDARSPELDEPSRSARR